MNPTPPPPSPSPAIPPPGSQAARLILKWIIDLINPPQPIPPGMAELEAYMTVLLAAGVVPADEVPA
jgi:hypothetical protein